MKLTQKVKNFIKKFLTKKNNKRPMIPGSSYISTHDDYVGEDELDQISRDSISLYTCEMPEEKLAKIKALSTPDYRMRHYAGLSSQDNIKDTVGTKSVAYHGQYSPNPHQALRTQDDCLARGQHALARYLSLLADHEDYMNMEEPNYDDYMYFSELSTTAALLEPCPSRLSSSLDAPPPYAEKDPLYKLFSRYEL
eukprot:TRINITY_DN3591_c0_g1_i3.p1 TRINITY_DN3591_c0_g1~~TRINITY_DN3591_c0_g1_i3.p1  ORF type:complete len:195 (+),score=49.86 TRINITY_DN3591_c0_g1_i3:247-831(+)